MKLRNLYLTAIAAGVCLGSIPAAHAGIVVTIEDPGVQASQVAGVTTETFTSLSGTPTLVSTIGTYTGGGIVQSADQYGGAGGTGKYFAIGAESGNLDTSLALTGSESYFGLWMSAADATNGISLYSGGTLLGSLNGTALIAAATANPAYIGNPNSGANAIQPYVYVNFFGTSGTTFDRVDFHNPNTSTGFESDNHSILTAATTPEGTVIVGGFTPVPEPASPVIILFGALAITAMVVVNRRRSTTSA